MSWLIILLVLLVVALVFYRFGYKPDSPPSQDFGVYQLTDAQIPVEQSSTAAKEHLDKDSTSDTKEKDHVVAQIPPISTHVHEPTMADKVSSPDAKEMESAGQIAVKTSDIKEQTEMDKGTVPDAKEKEEAKEGEIGDSVKTSPVEELPEMDKGTVPDSKEKESALQGAVQIPVTTSPVEEPTEVEVKEKSDEVKVEPIVPETPTKTDETLKPIEAESIAQVPIATERPKTEDKVQVEGAEANKTGSQGSDRALKGKREHRHKKGQVGHKRKTPRKSTKPEADAAGETPNAPRRSTKKRTGKASGKKSDEAKGGTGGERRHRHERTDEKKRKRKASAKKSTPNEGKKGKEGEI